MIPKHWQSRLLEDVAKFISGGTPSKKESSYWNGDFPWVSAKDMKSFRITDTGLKLSPSGKQASKIAPAESVLILVRGMTLLKDLPVCYIDQELAFNQDVKALIPSSDISGYFLAYLLRGHKNKILKLVDIAGHGTGRLNTDSLKNYCIDIPPDKEQKKIVEILEAWDNAIATTEKIITAKQKLKDGLLQRLIFGQRRLIDSNGFEYQKHRWFSVPSDWGVVPISKIAKSVSCKNSDDLDIPVLSCTKHFGLVDSLEYFGKQIFSKDTSTYKIVERHDFAYATNHIEEGSIGYQNLHEKALVSPMYTVFRVIDDRLSDDYLFKVLKTELFRHIFQANTSASVDRRGSLRWNQFSQLKVPIPPLEEQTAICSVLNDAQQEIDCLNEYKECVQKQKRGLMQKLLTGEWPVKVEEAA